MTPTGLPHSEIPGSQPARGSPRRFVAGDVLLRLPVPRHPPCALSYLTTQSAYSRKVCMNHHSTIHADPRRTSYGELNSPHCTLVLVLTSFSFFFLYAVVKVLSLLHSRS